jgi:3-deoxy-manno-octulosonate cytidylyltransferase (CMP-KDO synthetase)
MDNESTHSPGSVVGVIPARLASTRLPRKVLLNRTGKFLIQHVWEAAQRAKSLERLIIAADSGEVVEACRGFGAEVILTREDHPNGTSRLGEVADALKLDGHAIVVNVQGDEPDLDAGAIDAGVECLKRMGSERCPVATLASPFGAGDDVNNPAIVKVVTRRNGSALYFSRAAIPHHRVGGSGEQKSLRHVGMYIYRRWFLAEYAKLAPTSLERTEVLEQLRILEYGYEIAVAEYACESAGIDTPEQYEAFVRRHQASGNRH